RGADAALRRIDLFRLLVRAGARDAAGLDRQEPGERHRHGAGEALQGQRHGGRPPGAELALQPAARHLRGRCRGIRPARRRGLHPAQCAAPQAAAPAPPVAAMAEQLGLDNPMGTDGFEFVEYAAPEPAALGRLFEQMGFTAVARHRAKDVTLYRQGDVNFILNAEPASFAQAFARVHGPSICAIAFRVKNAAQAYKRALSLGAWGVEGRVGPMELNIPAIKGIGDSLIYLVDRYGERGTVYDVDFEYLPGVERHPKGVGLTYIDHLTHNVHRGR